MRQLKPPVNEAPVFCVLTITLSKLTSSACHFDSMILDGTIQCTELTLICVISISICYTDVFKCKHAFKHSI